MHSETPPNFEHFPPKRSCLKPRSLVVAVSAFVATSTGFVVLGATEELLDGGHATPVDRVSLVTSQFTGTATWTDSRCGSCHVFDRISSHPVGVQASASLNDVLKLDQGAITCTTCHKDADYLAHDQAIETGDPMLRVSAGELCIACHDPASGSREDAHASMELSAHPSSRTSPTTQASLGSGVLDPTSTRCLVCHDGMIAADAGTDVRLSGVMFSENHPVGIEYPQSDSNARWLNLHSSRDLDSRIRLFDGIVGCASCHDVYSHARSMLVIENDESRLCMACHNL